MILLKDPSANVRCPPPYLRQLADQLVASGLDARLEVAKALGGPVGMFVHGIGDAARESDVENIVLIVAAVAVDALAKARGSEGDASFAHHGVRAVVAVRVSPDAVHLWICISVR